MARRALELPLAADRDGRGTADLTARRAAPRRDGGRRLATGERLPSTRTLAGLLGVSRTVVTAAYAQLFAEGWVEGRHGSGTFVADGAPGRPAEPGQQEPVLAPRAGRGTRDGLPELDGTSMIDLRPGIAWTEGIDRAAWRRAWRSAGTGITGDLPDPRGRADLRTALTGYLRRSRGVHCSARPARGDPRCRREPGPARLAVAAGRPGGRGGAGIPGRQGRVRRARAAGGAVPGGLRRPAGGRAAGGLRLVYATPAHQYPLGARLSVPRRRALTAWARDTGALIVEDDYDGEFRYDVAPLPALFGMDPEVVVYLGTTTKILTPAMRVGWLAASPVLAARLAAAAGSWGTGRPGPPRARCSA